MMYYDVYIGRNDDPRFSWRSEGQEGHPPCRVGPFFPSFRGVPTGYPGGPFGELLDRIDKGRLEGGQVDWGAWVATATRAEIMTFVDEVYSDRPESAEEVRAFVKGLDPDETYALVAAEL